MSMPQTPEPDPSQGPPAVPTSQTPAPGMEWAPVAQYPSGPAYQPSAGWAYAPAPPPAPRRSQGRLVGIVLGAVAAGAALAVTAGLLLGSQATAGHGQDEARDVFAVPEIGACYDSQTHPDTFNTGVETDEPISCDTWHFLETIDAGLIEGADPAVWLKEPDDLTHALFARCEETADRILGANWTMTYTQLVLSIPGLAAWRQGALWYRCDLGRTDQPWGGLTSSKGGIRETAELLTCATWRPIDDGNDFENLMGADCDVAHYGEFAGAFRASYEDEGGVIVTNEEKQALGEGCWQLVLDFLDRGDLSEDLTFWYFTPSSKHDLDQNVVCVVAATGVRRLIGSLKGIGTAPLPFA